MDLAQRAPFSSSSQVPFGESTASNVKVAIRVRPLSMREYQEGSTETIQLIPGTNQLIVGSDKSFSFDQIFAKDVSQQQVFAELVQPMLHYFLTGYNCSVIAYGQTGSGKTFTMGTGLDGNLDELTLGIVPRSVEHILDQLLEQENSWEMLVSFLEIYNEDIIDLLSPSEGKKSSIAIREDVGGEIYLAGIKEEPVRSSSEILRTTKSTDMNLVSSRSHAIFTIILRLSNSAGESLSSKLHFVDLAGSERLKRTNASGDRAKESISINSGLLALGNVISALGDESKHATHIPYRDSKLTRLLQDSLGGNSRTLMIACISPSTDNYNETLNTLKYANRAKNIKNRVTVNHDANGSAAFEVVQLKKQVAALKQELLLARSMSHSSKGAYPSTPNRFAKSDGSLPTDCSANENVQKLLRQNAELKARLAQSEQAKMLVEAERDALKMQQGGQNADPKQVSVIKKHLTTIAELKERVRQLESSSDKRPRTKGVLNDPTRSPSAVLAQSSELVDRARQNISEQLVSIDHVTKTLGEIEMQSIPPEQFKAAVETRVQALLGPIKEDLGLKEELTHSLHTIQLEYMAMQQRFNERIRFLHDNLNQVQRQQQANLPSSQQAVEKQPETLRSVRVKYEDQIKRMGKELNELRKRCEHLQKEQSAKQDNNDSTIRSLRTTITQLKSEKARLAGQLSEESMSAKQSKDAISTLTTQQMADLRARERKANEAAKKWHKAYDFQKALLQRRIEQCTLARTKIRTLVNVIKRHRLKVSSSGFDTPGWRQLLTATPSMSRIVNEDERPPGTPMDLVSSPAMGSNQFVSRLQSSVGKQPESPKSRLAYGWVPTEAAPLTPTNGKGRTRDFFAQIADAASLSLRANQATTNDNPFQNRPK